MSVSSRCSNYRSFLSSDGVISKPGFLELMNSRVLMSPHRKRYMNTTRAATTHLFFPFSECMSTPWKSDNPDSVN